MARVGARLADRASVGEEEEISVGGDGRAAFGTAETLDVPEGVAEGYDDTARGALEGLSAPTARSFFLRWRHRRHRRQLVTMTNRANDTSAVSVPCLGSYFVSWLYFWLLSLRGAL